MDNNTLQHERYHPVPAAAAKDGVQLIVDEDTTVKLVDKAKNFKDTKKHWAKDLGFGEFFPATGRAWKSIIMMG